MTTYKKIIGENPNVYAKCYDDGTMDCIFIEKRTDVLNMPFIWKIVRNAIVVSLNWQDSNEVEFNTQCREFKNIINIVKD